MNYDDANDIFKASLSFLPVIVVLSIVSFIMYYAIHDIKSLGSNAYIYSILIIVPITFAYIYFVYSSGSTASLYTVYSGLSNMSSSTFFSGLFAIMKLAVLILLIQYFSKTESAFNMYTTNIIIFLMFVIGLAILYNMFINYFAKLEGWPGLFANMIFYIPCLITDFIEYLKNQFHITPNIVFVLFILEIAVILLYVYWPKIVTSLSEKDGTPLITTPVFLDSKVQLISAGSLPMIQRQTVYDTSGNIVPATTLVNPNAPIVSDYYRNYAISMWIFINPQPTVSQMEQVIFEYDNTNPSINFPKPRITYYVDPSNNLDTYLIYYTTPTVIKYSLNIIDDIAACRARITGIPNQRWNQFAFNYNNNTADLFVNGELLRTFNMGTVSLPTYGIFDQISIGQDNGLDGAICNVVYYTRNLSNMEIVNAYNILQYSNPPV